MKKSANSVHDLILSMKDGMEPLYVADEIENITKEREKESYDKGWNEGKRAGYEAKESNENVMFAGFTLAGGIVVILVIVWIVGMIGGCEANNEKARQDKENLISTTLSECTKGNYDACRAGWIHFKSETESIGYDANGYHVYGNPIDASFEEAYFNSTSKDLITDKDSRFSTKSNQVKR